MAHTTAFNIDGLVDPDCSNRQAGKTQVSKPTFMEPSNKTAHDPEPSKLSLHAHGFRYMAVEGLTCLSSTMVIRP